MKNVYSAHSCSSLRCAEPSIITFVLSQYHSTCMLKWKLKHSSADSRRAVTGESRCTSTD